VPRGTVHESFGDMLQTLARPFDMALAPAGTADPEAIANALQAQVSREG
jgi:hypothetical protein